MNEGRNTIIARCGGCKEIVFAAVNDPRVVDADMKKEISEMVAAGCSIEHTTADVVRSSPFGCECKSH